MKTRIISMAVGIVVATLLVGCGLSDEGRVTQADVDRTVATAVADTEERVVASMSKDIKDHFASERERLHKELLADYNEAVDVAVEAIAGKGAEAEVRMLKEAEAFHAFNQQVTRSVCEADYWNNSAWAMIAAILRYMSGSITDTEELQAYFGGIAINAVDYYSNVCNVTDDWRWELRKTPEVIDAMRRG